MSRPSLLSSNFLQNRHLNRWVMGVSVFVMVCTPLIWGGWAWAAAVFVMALLCYKELSAMLQQRGVAPSATLFCLVTLALVVLAAVGKVKLFLPVVTAGVIGLFFSSLFRKPRRSLADMGASLFSLLYLGFMLPHFILLRQLPNEAFLISLQQNTTTLAIEQAAQVATASLWFYQQEGFWLVFWTILVIAMADTGGYYGGKLFGKHLLYPELSPKKTREGALGSLILGVSTGLILGHFCGLAFAHRFILSTLLVVVGALGDLVESQIKREAGVKDSGLLLQAHGGLLDRLDSYIFSGTVAYYYVHWFVRKEGLAELFLSVSSLGSHFMSWS